MTFKIEFYRLRSGHIFNENLHCCYGRRQWRVLRIPAKVLIHVCSYDFYDTTLSTGKQRRHMITQFYNIKVGFKGTFIARTCFPDEILLR